MTFVPGCADAPYTPRQRDRRQALADLLGALSRALDRRNDISLLRASFEQMLRRLVPVRSIQLREIGSRWAGRVDTGSGTESIALEVSGSDQSTQGVLEATFDPRCHLGEWDFQMLSLASHVGALVLEIERNRIQLARAGLLGTNRPKRDDADTCAPPRPSISAGPPAMENRSKSIRFRR